MKTILVPTQNIHAMKSTLETAVLLAQHTGAYVEGVPLWFSVPALVMAELATTVSIETYQAQREEETAEARKLFETFMQEHGIAAAGTTRTALRLAGLPRCRPVKTLSATLAARSM